MQVFTGDMGDYHRTRLTHTHEVATVARTIGRVLRLNEDLIEALALLHDIGHPPFGHSGEAALHERLASFGGFSHNQFALTIVRELESRYSVHSGLNLSWEVLEGQDFRITHQGALPSLEVQVVDLADSIAYNAHDADDAMKLGLLSFEQLAELSLVQRAMAWQEPVLPESVSDAIQRKLLVHHLIEVQVADLLETALNRLQPARGCFADGATVDCIELNWSSSMVEERRLFSQFLFENVYRHPQLVAVRERAGEKIRELFDLLTSNESLLPERFRFRAESIGVARAAAEYIGGMTDRFCDSQHHELVEMGCTAAADWH